jgi:hypothetical protein
MLLPLEVAVFRNTVRNHLKSLEKFTLTEDQIDSALPSQTITCLRFIECPKCEEEEIVFLHLAGGPHSRMSLITLCDKCRIILAQQLGLAIIPTTETPC